MHIKHFRTLLVSVCLARLAHSPASAQPLITTQPADQFVQPGANVVIEVRTAAPPLSYQWLFDGSPIAGATKQNLLLPHVEAPQSGYYSAIVSNASGSVTSMAAVLKFFPSSPIPHGFSAIQALTNGSIDLAFKGETTVTFAPYYDIYPLETSSNLLDWAPLAMLQRANRAPDALQFVDTNAPEFSRRFYRTPENALLTPDPLPTGPYPVGTFSMLLTDPSRTNTVRHTSYQFMVTFWYPAVAQAGVNPAKYVDEQAALFASSYYDLTNYGGRNFGSQAASFFSHSISNAPIATSIATYPIVLYQPGAGGHRRENTDKAEDLASWGYVVVGLDTSDTDVSVFPNGTVVDGQGIGNTESTIDGAIEGRLLDMQFVLDELESLNAGDPRLAGQLDLNNIGVFGWSLGGATAAQLCLRDPRCKAGAAMDGNFFETNLLTQPLPVPLLFLRGGYGSDPDPVSGLLDGRPNDRLEVYNEQVTNTYWVKLASTVHGSFADPDLIDDSASVESFWGTPTSGQFLPPARVSQIVRAYLLSFFNKFLKRQDDHLLDGPSPAYPEVLQFLSKSGFSVQPQYPFAALVQGSDGNFYGTTEYGGAGNFGAVFQITPAGGLKTMVSFNGTNGAYPDTALVQGADGNFYGTTSGGGVYGDGTVFKINAAGLLTTLISFNGTNGNYPCAGLIQGSDGNFWGTTGAGGAGGVGTVFKMSPAALLTTLVSFKYGDGAAPCGPLLQGSDGNLYGTTSGGGGVGPTGVGAGTVFNVSSAGVLTTVASFISGIVGFAPVGLVQGSDGNFYGTAANGGILSLSGGYGLGTLFKVSPAGLLTTLVSFNGANGSFPQAALIQGSDGNFYGTTYGGGAGGAGTVFRITPAGVLTTLISFSGPNGSSPQAPLVQGRDGNFYGTTLFGGAGGFGTVFKMTPDGTMTSLVSFGAN